MGQFKKTARQTKKGEWPWGDVSKLEFVMPDSETKAQIMRRFPDAGEEYDFATYGGKRYAFWLQS